jgi:3,4-dihydroxy 2-butanone 4-phosphate synthase/GTP cyclohydrolase II
MSEFSQYISSAEEIIEDTRNGKMIVLVDAEDRENEGDLIIPAQMATPDAINFMAKFGRGLICLTLMKDRADQLGLELMSQNNRSRHQTAFTVSIEAREGISTGISAHDRSKTVSVAYRPDQKHARYCVAGSCVSAGCARWRRPDAGRTYRGLG